MYLINNSEPRREYYIPCSERNYLIDNCHLIKFWLKLCQNSSIIIYHQNHHYNTDKMWPILMQFLRSNAPYITLPIAAVVGVIGYNLESLLSDRYTPYNKPVQDQRLDRLTEEEMLNDPTNVQKLKYKENVLGKNLSPSLQKQ